MKFLLVGVIVLAGAVEPSQAQNYTISDGNSSATVNASIPGGGTGLIGMNNWSIAGQNQLNQQWFWYRIDNIGAPFAVNQTIDSLGLAGTTAYDGTRGLRTTYGVGMPISVVIDYHITGVTSLKSDIAESITVNNNTGTPLALHFFQYADLNLAGTAGGDAGVIGANAFTGLYNTADQVEGTIAFHEAVITPGASHAEVSMPPSPISGLLGTAANLNNSTGLTGTGNIAYGFEWDGNGLGSIVLNPGDQLVISKDKFINLQTVPEPSSLALLMLTLGGCGCRRFLRKQPGAYH